LIEAQNLAKRCGSAGAPADDILKAPSAWRKGSMRVLEVVAPNHIQLAERPTPVPGPGQVRIRVHWAGVCGTDLAVISGKSVFARYPVVAGHELSGRIAAVGEGVDLRPGLPVTINPVLSCQRCEACRRGDIHLCADAAVLGVAGTDGGFADELIVPAYVVRELPEDLSLEAAALCEPTAVAVRAARCAEIKPGDRVAILGAGSLGLAIVQIARVLGAARVAVTDPVRSRVQIALGLGASELTAGEGAGDFDVVIDGVGAAETMQRAVELAHRGGTLAVYGVPNVSRLEIPVQQLFRNNLNLRFSRLYPADMSEAISLLRRGDVTWDAIVTHRVALEDLPATIAALMADPGIGIKVLARIAGSDEA
jgi:2-desacetyl-2-hydroxyethyl bacteriochlorophyllide A dehydrogenase